MRVRTHWDAKGTGKAKVGELDVAVRVNQQVLRLQVAVQHTVRVAELDALEELPHIALEHGKGWDFFLGGRGNENEIYPKNHVKHCKCRLHVVSQV